MFRITKSLLFSFIIGLFVNISSLSLAENKPHICAVYLTGIGCSHCAISDPFLFVEMTTKHPSLVILEYEIYRYKDNNAQVKDQFFHHYWGPDRRGVPFFILDADKKAMGSQQILRLEEIFKEIEANSCPMPNGENVDFWDLDVSQLTGKVSIWTKNRVLISENTDGSDSEMIRRIIAEVDIRKALKDLPYKEVEPFSVAISNNEIIFENAVELGAWTILWNGQAIRLSTSIVRTIAKSVHWIFAALIGILFLASFIKIEHHQKKWIVRLRDLKKKKKDYVVIFFGIIFLVGFFMLAKNASPDVLEHLGYEMPLGVFTFFIALVDGFNPCNMFVLTCLMALLISSSESKLRLYIVGASFVTMVFLIYFLFMSAWLNVFNVIHFVKPLRIVIALFALLAGVINCKDFLFFKKGISLTIPDQQRGFLMKKIYRMKSIIQNGSFPVLISSSLMLAALASLVELPCTAGFPIIYTSILSAKVLDQTIAYYGYLIFYNMVYVLPLFVIITIFILAFKGQPVSQRQMEILKFIGGFIMILLGIILLVNPQLVGLGIG